MGVDLKELASKDQKPHSSCPEEAPTPDSTGTREVANGEDVPKTEAVNETKEIPEPNKKVKKLEETAANPNGDDDDWIPVAYFPGPPIQS